VSNPQPLGPRSFTDLIDAAFWIYRRNFGTLLLIGALVQAPALLIQSQIQSWVYSSLFGLGSAYFAIVILLVGVVSGTLYAMFAGSLMDCGLVSAVAQISQDQPTSVQAAFRAGLGALPALVLAASVTGLLGALARSLGGLFLNPLLLMGGMGAGSLFGLCFGAALLPLAAGALLLYARLALTAPAVLLERIGPLAGLRRSWGLTRGALGRTLMVVAVLGCFNALLTWAPYTLVRVLPRASAADIVVIYRALGLLVGAATVLVTPLNSIAFTLLYYDQRSRSEGYDLERRLVDTEGYGRAP
jgi:hypothetical protein